MSYTIEMSSDMVNLPVLQTIKQFSRLLNKMTVTAVVSPIFIKSMHHLEGVNL